VGENADATKLEAFAATICIFCHMKSIDIVIAIDPLHLDSTAFFLSVKEAKRYKQFLLAKLYHGLRFLQVQLWRIGPHSWMERNQEKLKR